MYEYLKKIGSHKFWSIDFNWLQYLAYLDQFSEKFVCELNRKSSMESFNAQNARECALRLRFTTNFLVLEYGTSLHAKCWHLLIAL